MDTPQMPQSLLTSGPGGCLPDDWLSSSVLPSTPHASWASCLMTLLCPTDKVKLLRALSPPKATPVMVPVSLAAKGSLLLESLPHLRALHGTAGHRLRPVASRTPWLLVSSRPSGCCFSLHSLSW